MDALSLSSLLEGFDACVEASDLAWLLEATVDVRDRPDRVVAHLAAVGQRIAATPLPAASAPWCADDVARLLLLRACGDEVDRLVPEVYRRGDERTRRALILGLPLLPRLSGRREVAAVGGSAPAGS